MDPAFARAVPASNPSFRDGLGERFLCVDKTGGEALEMLCLRPELTAVPSFEFALRERVGRLANFRHAYYGRVRRVDRSADSDGGLTIVYEHTPGARLSEILGVAERERLALDINAALCLIRQLVPAVAMLHQNARDVSHGALAAERIVVTPHARLVIVEYVLGSALEQLHFSHERLWSDFRVAMPPSAGLPRFDHRADVAQIGIVALSLVLGRPLRDDEYPRRISEVLANASETSALGGREPLAPALKQWLARALQLDYRQSFHSALEAQNALDEVLNDESGYIAAPVALEAFLSRYQDCAIVPDVAQPLTPPSSAVRPQASTASSGAHSAVRSQPSAAQSGAHAVVRPQSPAPQSAAQTVVRLQPSASAAQSGAHAVVRPQSPAPQSGPHAPVGPAQHPVEPVMTHFAEAPTLSREPSFSPLTPVHSNLAPRDDLFSLDPDRLFTPPAEPVSRPPEPAAKRPLNQPWRRMAVVAVVVLSVAQAGFIGFRLLVRPAALPATTGAVAVESRPTGAEVVIDGRVRGITPLKLSLPPGPHSMEIKSPGGEPRVIPIKIQSGVEVSQYIELQGGTAAGHLQVRTEPSGARVSVDGQPRGSAPVTVSDLAPGDHEVLLESDYGAVRQTVTVQAGATASLVVPLSPAPGAPLSGWVAVSAPVDVQIFDGGRLIGTSESERIMVSAGHHEFQVVNETLGYKATRVVQVSPGKVASVKIELPRGTVHLNAVPWAEVWIDGEKVGETPIGNLSVPIGPHEITFRNPQFAEQRHAATVTLSTPLRLSVDLRK